VPCFGAAAFIAPDEERAHNFCIKTGYYDFLGMLNYKLYAKGGLTPAAVAPPNAITPGQVHRQHRSAQEVALGDRHYKLRHRTSTLNFIAE